MNFNVHRRNKSLVAQSSFRQKKEARSLKKMNNSSSVDNLFTEAKEIYQSQGDLTEAVKLFTQYLAFNPWNSEALYLCAVCELKVGQYQSAVSHLLSIPDDYVHKANSILLHAMALNKLGKTSQSLQVVNECIRRYQNFEEAICFRGKLYMSLSYFHRAEQDFRTLISKPDCSFLPHNSLGDCYRSQGKPDKALGPYLKAIETLQAVESNKSSESLRKQVFLKIGICLYQLQRWKQARSYIEQAGKAEQIQGCEYHYYLGGTLLKLGEKQKGLLHLQYCLRTQGSSKLMRKAYKKLIQLYLQNYQFYEALNVVRLGDIVNLQIEGWDRVVGAFMLIIKGSFEEGLSSLNEVYAQLKSEQESKRLLKIKRDSSQGKPNKQSRYNENFKVEKKLFAASPAKASSKEKGKFSHAKMGYFSTKSVVRAIPKIESMRLHEKSGVALKKQQDLKLKTELGQREGKKQLYSAKQKQFMYPLVLLFKAYSQFFTEKYMQSLDSYEQYQNFIKDVFGKESDVVYNKTLCEGLLMAESDMQEEALTKYSTCIDLYYQKNGVIPVQPLLYKIILLVRLALEQTNQNEKSAKLQQEATSSEILESTIQMMDNYQPVLSNHSLALYFRGLVYLLLNRFQQSRQWLQKALKIAEDCSWRCLWIKGVVEMKMGNYYQAVKQFSAGLILENRAELYLGRSISFLLLSEQAQAGVTTSQVKTLMKSVHLGETAKNQKQSTERSQAKKKSDNLIQSCFEDLQKYIELQTSQEDISLWVSKILFRNKAYDEAIRSIRKIRVMSQEVISMIESIQIYEGNFQKGGEVGLIIKSAFDGLYLTKEEESCLLQSEVVHDMKSTKPLMKDSQTWMVVVHLYVTQNYSLLLKYLQKQLFSQLNSKIVLLLRYNIMIAYFLLGEHKKAANSCRAMLSSTSSPTMTKILTKIDAMQFDQDQCLEDLKEDLNMSCSKLLSNYLPFRSIFINQQKTVRVYVRPSIPFPQFQAPEMNIPVSNKLVGSEIVASAVQKKLEAPWIRKTQKKTVQFMQKLQQSGVYLTGETTSFKDSGSDPFLL